LFTLLIILQVFQPFKFQKIHRKTCWLKVNYVSFGQTLGDSRTDHTRKSTHAVRHAHQNAGECRRYHFTYYYTIIFTIFTEGDKYLFLSRIKTDLESSLKKCFNIFTYHSNILNNSSNSYHVVLSKSKILFNSFYMLLFVLFKKSVRIFPQTCLWPCHKKYFTF